MTSIFSRVSDIINANINDLLDRIEDPERMIKQVIREMEENITQAKEGVISAIASEKQLARELENQREQAAAWLKKAETALEAGKEDLARSALARKKEYDAIADGLQPSHDAACKNSARLKTQLRKLEQKLEEAKRKRTALLARQRATEARAQMHKTADKFAAAGTEADVKFGRMEDKIAEMEAIGEAIDELEKDDALEKEFAELEIDQEVEDELAALKKKLNK